jgi:hypothetical protein
LNSIVSCVGETKQPFYYTAVCIPSFDNILREPNP